MKRMKKVFALLLTMVMVLAMAVPAMAATGDITINGAIKDATYTAYKIFDATYEEGAVSYTIPSGSTIDTVDGFTDVFSTFANGGNTYVTQKGTKEEVLQWLKDKETSITSTANQKATKTNTAGAASVTLSTGEAGYYYIKATIGTDETGFKSAVTIDSAHPTVTVNSKINDTPDVPVDGKKINDKTVTTMDVGETATFTLKFNATNYAVDEDGTNEKITSYTVSDTMDGFSITEKQLAALTVTVGSTPVSSTVSEDDPYFTATKTTDGLKVIISNYDKGNYTSPSAVVISYLATLTNKNVVGESTNKFNVTYNETKIPNEPEIYTYNYKLVVDKYALNSEKPEDKTAKLAGAKFVLKNGTGADAEFYSVDANTGVVTWVTNQDEATVVTTDANGSANFQGLKAGTYYLVETEAPAGYNLLKDPTVVTLADITAKLTENTTLTQTASVANNKGAELPSTGGIGTTIFYVIGAVCVLGAGVLLVTRRRMASK